MIKNLTDVQFDQSINLAEEEILFILIETNEKYTQKTTLHAIQRLERQVKKTRKSAIIINTHLPG